MQAYQMNLWAPVFGKIVESSLWTEDDLVVKVFITMLAKKDADQIVRANAFGIGQWAKKSEADTLKALKVLSSPDTKRLEPQPYQGRRIEKVEEGWLVLNGMLYELEMRKTSRRIYKARKEAERREKLKAGIIPSKPLPGEREYVANVEDLGQEAADRIFNDQQFKGTLAKIK